jgi:hypothetical protein
MDFSKFSQFEVKPVKNYEAFYVVSFDGRVYEIATGQEVAQHMTLNGSAFVRLARYGTVKNKKLDKIVAHAFVPNPHGFHSVSHKDGNKQNNRAENIFWYQRRKKT